MLRRPHASGFRRVSSGQRGYGRPSRRRAEGIPGLPGPASTSTPAGRDTRTPDGSSHGPRPGPHRCQRAPWCPAARRHSIVTSATLRSASTLTCHSTGSFSSLARMAAGEISRASEPSLSLSPWGANGLGTFSRWATSASPTAPSRTLTQFSSVSGGRVADALGGNF
jgi:hypothetical protein